MSIATEIQRLTAAKAAIKSAINAKGGTLTTELLDDYADAVAGLPSGSDTVPVPTKVVTYTPYRAAFSGVSSIAVSGFTTYDQWGEDVDVSYLNGTYNVTPETQYVTDSGKRVYKHASANYYLYHIYSEDWMEHFWIFASSVTANSPYSAIFAHSGDSLPSGTATWTNHDSYAEVSAGTAATTTNYSEQLFALSAADATDIASGWVWSFGNAASLAGCDFPAAEGYIHLRHGTRIITPPVAHPGPGVAPVFSLPLHLNALSPTGHTVTTTGAEYEFVRKLGRECCHFARGGFSAAVSQQSGAGARTISGWICNPLRSGWTMPFGFGSWENGDNYQLCFRLADSSLVPHVMGAEVGGSNRVNMNDYANAWAFAALSVSAEGVASFYLNGALFGTATTLGSAPNYSLTTVLVGGDSPGVYISDVNLYTAALSADQMAALYKREALYMGTVIR